MIFRGPTFAIQDFRISIDASGEMTSSMRPQIAWEMWPLWLCVAIDHEAAAKIARERLATTDHENGDQQRPALIEEETRAGMVAISAVAFTIEAMALSAATHAGLRPGVGRRVGAARRVAETLKQCLPSHRCNSMNGETPWWRYSRRETKRSIPMLACEIRCRTQACEPRFLGQRMSTDWRTPYRRSISRCGPRWRSRRNHAPAAGKPSANVLPGGPRTPTSSGAAEPTTSPE